MSQRRSSSRWPAVEIASDAILFADADVVAVDKPTGVLSDASRDPDRQHLGTALRRWALENGEHGDDFHAVHRLDLGTSGVVLFARSRPVATALMQQFQDRSVTKQYQAVVTAPAGSEWTTGTTFERRSYLRHRRGVSEEVRSGGKTAETIFEVADVQGDLALVRALPKTGRTHQLRVHLAAVGAPILGDDRYCPQPPSGDRLWLHARRLEVTHPTTGEPLVIKSRLAIELVDGEPRLAAV